MATLYMDLDEMLSESIVLERETNSDTMYGDIDAGENQCRIDQFKEMTEQHKYHTKQLETLIRMLDNDTVEVDQIKNIKDDVEYYIESCQDPVINTTPIQTSTPQT